MKTIKRLCQSVREFKLSSILTPSFVALEVVLECLITYEMSLLIDQGIYAMDMKKIIIYGVILILMAILSLACGVMSGIYGAKASAGFARNLRRDMFVRIQGFSFSNIDKFSTSSLVTRLTTDISNVQMSYMMIIRGAVRSPLMLIFSLVMSFSINWKMAFIFVAILPLLGGVLFLGIKLVFPIFDSVFRRYDKLNESVQENVKGMRVVKSYVREDFEKEKFDVASENVKKDFVKGEKIIALNSPVMQFAIYASISLVSILGAIVIIKTLGGASYVNGEVVAQWGEFSTGKLSSLITYGMQMLMSLMMLAMIMVVVVTSRASADRIVEVLDEDSTLKNPENPIMDVKDGSIEFNNVSFKYSEKAEKSALSDINLKINSGETIGIIGGTGSSKSSLVQLIARLYDVNEGSVTVGGHDVREYDLETLRNQVAMVLQKNILFSGTIKENLRWGNKDACDDELVRVSKLAQADDFIQGFPEKYDHKIEQGGSNVSGGQKQRLCIARALLKKPKILILDDSTSAVDTKTDALIRKAFKEEIPNTTKIIIAQRIASVQDADKIIVLDGGKIVSIGTHEELLKSNEIYQEVYYSQNKIENKVEGGVENA